jgi:hypothetical protein
MYAVSIHIDLYIYIYRYSCFRITNAVSMDIFYIYIYYIDIYIDFIDMPKMTNDHGRTIVGQTGVGDQDHPIRRHGSRPSKVESMT